MSNALFQAIDLDTHQPVGTARNSIQFARSDATSHFNRTGKHCAVCRIEMVWVTSTLDDLQIDAPAA
jgi:hypothetical protein